MLRHGVQREVFISHLVNNATTILKTGQGVPDTSSLLSAKEVAERGIERWMKPRALRRPEYSSWTIENLIELFGNQSQSLRCESASIRSTTERA